LGKYNLNIFIDERLRDIPENPEDVLRFIKAEKEKLNSIPTPKERVAILGKLGSYSRL
jgi:hypothetical protein